MAVRGNRPGPPSSRASGNSRFSVSNTCISDLRAVLGLVDPRARRATRSWSALNAASARSWLPPCAMRLSGMSGTGVILPR
jgi:hypothetical protein